MTVSHDINTALNLFLPTDTLTVPLATGQPIALLNALSTRTWTNLHITAGLFTYPYSVLTQPGVSTTSGYYGPIERFLNDSGFSIDYLPADFTGFGVHEARNPSRVIATTFSPPDSDGFLTFGTHSGAIDRAFRAACRDPNRIAIAEINTAMPRVYGHADYGDNKIHLDEINVAFTTEQSQSTLPQTTASDVETKIAEHIASLIPDRATLQFGIGAIPDLVATRLAASSRGEFGIHSELVSDGFLKLHQAGKISNAHKGIFDGQSVFTFAFGSQALYDFLDEKNGTNKRQAIILPVEIANDPSLIRKNCRFTSINSALAIDFAGQVCAESIGFRQYSGVGGQLAFVQGAYYAPEGQSILAIKSSAMVNGTRISTIVPSLAPGSIVSTPRHYVQKIVTEYGVADLFGVPDEKRPEELIKIAHPDFRDSLRAAYDDLKRTVYRLKS